MIVIEEEIRDSRWFPFFLSPLPGFLTSTGDHRPLSVSVTSGLDPHYSLFPSHDFPPFISNSLGALSHH